MPARRQLRVFASAGAIWFVERLPSPQSATPNFRPGTCALPMLLSSGAAAMAAVCVRKRRRSIPDMADPCSDGNWRASESSRTARSGRIVRPSTAWNRGSVRGYLEKVPGCRQQGIAVTTQINKLLACKGFFVFSVTLVLAGCAGNGEGLDANGRPVLPGPPANSDFQEIQDTIFTPICTTCHIGAGAPQGLRLDAGNSYALLVNVASAEVPGTLRVNPGNPDASYLVQKIEGTASVGVRMPANGPPYLPQDRIDLVRRWISCRRSDGGGARRPTGGDQHDSRCIRDSGSGPRKTHRRLQCECRQLAGQRRDVHAARRVRSDRRVVRSSRPRWPTERGRDHHTRRSRPAAINCRCTVTVPRRSRVKPATCSTVTSTASPAETCSFPSMSTQETPDDQLETHPGHGRIRADHFRGRRRMQSRTSRRRWA